MKRNLFAFVVAILAFATSAFAKDKITFARLVDPVYDAILYPIEAGIVKSDLIDIEISQISVPAVTQALITRQYDVVNVGAIQIPQAAEKGLKVSVMAVATRYMPSSIGANVWVLKESPYKTIADLKGKTIAVSTFTAGNTTMVRQAIATKYGMNVQFENGDFKWVAIATGSQAGALTTGKIDATTLLHTNALTALRSGTIRPILNTAKELHEKFGVTGILSVYTSYPDKVAARPKQFMEFNRMMKASRDYTFSNVDEVGAIIAKRTGLPASFLREFVDHVGESVATVSEDDIKSLNTSWQASKDMGIIKSFPDARSVFWEHAIPAKR